MERRRYLFYLYGFLMVLFVAMVVHSSVSAYTAQSRMAMGRRVVELLGLTDLCLTTEARYTRHPSQADYFTPFQDNPMSLEFFPSGGAMAPPLFEVPRRMVVE